MLLTWFRVVEGLMLSFLATALVEDPENRKRSTSRSWSVKTAGEVFPAGPRTDRADIHPDLQPILGWDQNILVLGQFLPSHRHDITARHLADGPAPFIPAADYVIAVAPQYLFRLEAKQCIGASIPEHYPLALINR
jgi:hypothetical protein